MYFFLDLSFKTVSKKIKRDVKQNWDKRDNSLGKQAFLNLSRISHEPQSI